MSGRWTRSKARKATQSFNSPSSSSSVSSTPPVKRRQLRIDELKGVRVAKKAPSIPQKAGKGRPRKKSRNKNVQDDVCQEVVFIDQCSPSSSLGESLADQEVSFSPEDDENLLREFDFNSAYGPCRGISRMERYERALKFNLKPTPSSRIRKILVARQSDPDFSKCVWDKYGFLGNMK